MKELDKRCKNCGFTLGSHSCTAYYSEHYKMLIPRNYCPGHEGRMDWDKGQGTTFSPQENTEKEGEENGR